MLRDLECGFLCIGSCHQGDLGRGGPQTLVGGIRNRPTLIEGGASSMEPDNFLRMRNRQLGKDYRVEQLEHAEIRANFKTKRKQRSQCEGGSATKLTQRVNDIAKEGLKPHHGVDVILTGGKHQEIIT